MSGRIVAPGGGARRDLSLRGPRVVFGARAAVVCLGGPVGLLMAPRSHLVAATVIVAVSTAWAVMVFGVAARSRTGVPAALLVCDALMILAVCATQSWTVPTSEMANGSDWVAVTVAVTVAAYPWRLRAAASAAMALFLVGGGVAVTVLTGPVSVAAAVSLGLWGIAVAALSGGQHHLIEKSAGLADEASRSFEAGRRDAAVARARAEGEREHLAALHDTAATTLLLVGQGMVTNEPWLADQAARDIQVLTGTAGGGSGVADLVALLQRTGAASPLSVDVVLEPSAGGGRAGTRSVATQPRAGLPVPADVAQAMCGSAREALGNAARHAGVEAAAVAIQVTDRDVVVEIRDRGRGFAPDVARQRGHGIAESIVGRMRRVGGEAEIATLIGGGTAVRLVWAPPTGVPVAGTGMRS